MNKRNIEKKIIKEKKTVALMIGLYCRKKHHQVHAEKDTAFLCPECRNLLDYVYQRIEKCPCKESKSFCSFCKIHCYKAQQREQIRKIMRFSGPLMMIYHPALAFTHLLLTVKEKISKLC